jgi:hypothetical protein
MGRCTVIRWACAAGVLCCWGCTATKSFSPFGWMQGPNTSQATASKDQSNPLKSSDPSAAPADGSASKDGSTAVRGSSDGDAAGSGFKSAAIDPALRKLMDDELQYVPADKRQAMFEEWAKFDPAFIRELVENHRMARELAESRHGGGSASGVKTASTGAAPEMPGFDEPAAKGPAAPKSATASPIRQVSAASSGAVSPWDDSLDTSSPTPAQAPKRTNTATPLASSTPPSLDLTPPSNSGRARDAEFDAPAVNAPATVHNGAGSKDSALALAPLSGTPVAGAGATTGANPPTPKQDAFSGLPPIDTEPLPGAATTPAGATAIASPSNAASPKTLMTPHNPPSTQVAGTDGAVGGISIQPGTAAPATVPAVAPPSASGSSVVQAAATDPFDTSTGGPVSAAKVASTQTNALDEQQPVKLGGPVDIPEGSVVAASDPGLNGGRASQATATGPGTTQPQPSAQPSGLASLPSRLLGAINPLPGNGGSRNVALPANWHSELQKIVMAAATEAGQTSVGSSDAEKLAYIQKQVNLRMLYLLSGQPARALEPIAGLEPADQEFWQQVFWGMSNYFDKSAIADPSDRATQTIAQLRAAVHKLQEKSKLELRNVAFCDKIENYGRYERFKRDEFTPGQQVLLYAEVENFKSEPTADGPYRAILKSTIEIFDSHGAVEKKMPFAPTEDLCASPRRDYYNSYEFVMPPQISLGPHTLKLTVEDQLSQKVATYTVNFTVK